jgi:hypothetical protein
MLLRQTATEHRSSRYRRQDLDTEARRAVKRLGRYRGWDLVIFGNGFVQLIALYAHHNDPHDAPPREFRIAI